MTGKSPNQLLADALQQCCEIDASLSERLGRFAAISRDLNPSYAKLVDDLIGRLDRAGVGASSPKSGEPMPPFLLTDHAGRMVGLDEVVRDGPVALIFHRGHWCPYCRINTRTLAQAYLRIRDLGGEIVAIMPDRQVFTRQMREQLQLPFAVLTDLDNGYALSLGLAVWIGAELRDFFTSRGHDLPGFHGNEAWMVPVPATFVVGRDREVKARFIDPDYRRGLEVETLLDAFRSIRR